MRTDKMSIRSDMHQNTREYAISVFILYLHYSTIPKNKESTDLTLKLTILDRV